MRDLVGIKQSSSIVGCVGITVGERYGDCVVIDFLYVPNRYFQLHVGR